MKGFLFSTILFMIISVSAAAQTDSLKSVLSPNDRNEYIELNRGPQKILLTIDHYTKRMKSLRKFSIVSISAGGAILGGGICLVATASRALLPYNQNEFGKIGIIGGSIAVTGGIVGLVMANSKLKKLKNKVDLRVSTRGGKVIYKF